jgi:hypothetical protein
MINAINKVNPAKIALALLVGFCLTAQTASFAKATNE